MELLKKLIRKSSSSGAVIRGLVCIETKDLDDFIEAFTEARNGLSEIVSGIYSQHGNQEYLQKKVEEMRDLLSKWENE